MSERFFEYDQVEIDASKIEEYEHDIFGPVTVFKDVVIAREIVQPYVVDGKTKMAYKPAKELEDSFWTAEGMWAIASGHPDTAIIMDRDQMQGRTVNVRFSKSLKDIKTKRPNNRGTVADLHVFNNKVAPELLEDMLSGKRHDVSIGFFFNKDNTPGIIEEDGHPLKGAAYDYVQRKIAINHTAFALESGRCPMPLCGIGADEITKLVTGDPFGKWETFEECVKEIMRENPDYTREQAEGTCGKIEKRSKEKKDMFREVLENMKNEIDAVLSKFDDIEEDAGTPKTEAERAMAHFNVSEEKWAALSEEEKQEYISKLPSRGEGLKKDNGETIVDENMSTEEDLPRLLAFYRITAENWDAFEDGFRIVLRSLWTERQKVYKDKDPAEMAGGESPLEDSELTGDEAEGDCDDCDDEEQTSSVEDKKPPVKAVPFTPTKSVEELIKRRR